MDRCPEMVKVCSRGEPGNALRALLGTTGTEPDSGMRPVCRLCVARHHRRRGPRNRLESIPSEPPRTAHRTSLVDTPVPRNSRLVPIEAQGSGRNSSPRTRPTGAERKGCRDTPRWIEPIRSGAGHGSARPSERCAASNPASGALTFRIITILVPSRGGAVV